jgi:hypothetical protein
MKASDFLSTPDDLLASAIKIGDYLSGMGWKLSIEPWDLAQPRTPVFIAKREHTRAIVEVQSTLDFNVIEEWVRFAKASQDDTRLIVALVVPSGKPVDPKMLEKLRGLGVGLFMYGEQGPYEVLPPKDLALQLELPEMPNRLRPILGHAYELFDRGQWREGFEHAVTRFEQEARRYLKARVKSGAIFVGKNGAAVTHTDARISKMTLGQLADVFAQMRSPNLADSRLGQCLKEVNPDRVTAAHYKGTEKVRERKFRKDVALNMFIVVNGLCFAKGISR